MMGVLRFVLLSMTMTAAVGARDVPAFDYQSVMDTYFDDTSGLISFNSYTVGFAPDEPFNGEVVVLNAGGEVVSRHRFFPDYAGQQGVFAAVQAVGPADVQLTEPGIYQLVFVVDGVAVTRMPVVLKQTDAGDDPFDPQPKFAFDGYWRTHAFVITRSYFDQPVPEVGLWLGGMDLPPDARRGGFAATLYRDGEAVAHSKAQRGSISPGHFELKRVLLFQPHTPKQAPNAEAFTMEDLSVDGAYELRVTRSEDGAMLRSYDFTVAEGEVRGLAQSSLDTEPVVDYVMPRVLKPGTTTFEMVPCTWIRDGG